MDKIKILHEPSPAEPFLLVDKPAGLPSAPLCQSDTGNALFQALELFPEIKKIHGKKEIEAGLLHRLDTATRGLLVIAASQEYYNHLAKVQTQDSFLKIYQAFCECSKDNAQKLGGFPQPASWKSFFRPYGKGRKEVRPVLKTSSSAAIKKIGTEKLYETKMLSLTDEKGGVKISCSLTQGFRHQVRCHLAWNGYPVIGDRLYNYEFRNSPQNIDLEFTACALEFPDLYSDKVFRFSIDQF